MPYLQGLLNRDDQEKKQRLRNLFKDKCSQAFLAPTGALEMLMFVRSYIRPSSSNLSRAVNLHLSASNLQAISQESVSSPLAVSRGGASKFPNKSIMLEKYNFGFKSIFFCPISVCFCNFHRCFCLVIVRNLAYFNGNFLRKEKVAVSK